MVDKAIPYKKGQFVVNVSNKFEYWDIDVQNFAKSFGCDYLGRLFGDYLFQTKEGVKETEVRENLLGLKSLVEGIYDRNIIFEERSQFVDNLVKLVKNMEFGFVDENASTRSYRNLIDKLQVLLESEIESDKVRLRKYKSK